RLWRRPAPARTAALARPPRGFGAAATASLRRQGRQAPGDSAAGDARSGLASASRTVAPVACGGAGGWVARGLAAGGAGTQVSRCGRGVGMAMAVPFARDGD